MKIVEFEKNELFLVVRRSEQSETNFLLEMYEVLKVYKTLNNPQ